MFPAISSILALFYLFLMYSQQQMLGCVRKSVKRHTGPSRLLQRQKWARRSASMTITEMITMRRSEGTVIKPNDGFCAGSSALQFASMLRHQKSSQISTSYAYTDFVSQINYRYQNERRAPILFTSQVLTKHLNASKAFVTSTSRH